MTEKEKVHAGLVESYGNDVYSTDQLTAFFTVEAFCAPFVTVTRKSDGVRGSMEFIHSPRFYFNFIPD